MITKNGHAHVLKAKADDGSVMFRLTEKKIDRYGEVVLPDGAVLDHYKTNPIVLIQHGFLPGRGQIPIGKLDTDRIKITSKAFDAPVIFDETGSDPFAIMIADKVRGGFLNAGSIGFNPIEISKEAATKGQTGPTHKKWELLEFSVVAIGALPSSLAKRDYQDILEGVLENFGEAALEEFEGYVNKFYGFDEQALKAFQDHSPELGELGSEMKEIKGRLKSLEGQIQMDRETPPPDEDGIVIVSEETLKSIDETMGRINEIANSLINS